MHGAGGFREDNPMATRLTELVGEPVDFRAFPDEDMSYEAWRDRLVEVQEDLGGTVAVVAHSFGASVALRHATEADTRWRGLALLAMPWWGPAAWDVPAYDYPEGVRLPMPVWLHHCEDDDVVPIAHLDHHASALPGASVRRHPQGGHQLVDRMGHVCVNVAGLAEG